MTERDRTEPVGHRLRPREELNLTWKKLSDFSQEVKQKGRQASEYLKKTPNKQ